VPEIVVKELSFTAKKQALENVDLMKYKLERQLRKFNNMIKSKKLLKAKELEEMDDYSY